MYIGYSEEQEQLRRELRAYYDKLLTPEVEEGLARGHGIGPVNREVVRQMGEDGWLGIGWPEEYGGQGRSAIEQFIFFDESMRAGAPVPMLTINTVGPTIMEFGTDEQKAEFLPRILRGEVHFCIGYTEPGAGTDLAALTTKAVRDGDEYIINGQKMFTSLAGGADYCWLAVRTDPEAKKHKGISMFIVPMDTPGIKLMPMDLMSDHDINQVFYDDVRVPASALVGGENNGWGLITNQLNRERVTLCSSGIIERALTDTRRWAQETKLADGRRVIDQEGGQGHLARIHARPEVLPPARSSPTGRPTSTSRSSRPAARDSTATRGPSSRRRACSGLRCRRARAGAGSGSWPCAGCSRRSAAPSRRSRCCRPSCWARCRSRSSAPTPRSSSTCRGSSPVTPCSRRRWSRPGPRRSTRRRRPGPTATAGASTASRRALRPGSSPTRGWDRPRRAT